MRGSRAHGREDFASRALGRATSLALDASQVWNEFGADVRILRALAALQVSMGGA